MNRPLHLTPAQATARRAGTLTLATGVSQPVRSVTSESLLEGARELVIHHQGGEYHLRLTRNDKLILTK